MVIQYLLQSNQFIMTRPLGKNKNFVAVLLQAKSTHIIRSWQKTISLPMTCLFVVFLRLILAVERRVLISNSISVTQRKIQRMRFSIGHTLNESRKYGRQPGLILWAIFILCHLLIQVQIFLHTWSVRFK